ncbi:hypothetical protein B5F07_17450 [Lachnoclostridium sp. An169]|uniref:Rpn family recombination-promoting nuclease/putative transposase n=1 Tax=Lachnoclostridium sp. An169 TaxID=1965569 RepID=UPI000B381387|nr:Rpn family recombination-promoting nuclease/putative transposase [Lachnoclostridium sp. An169]OUP81481.1 hypothetical protein B5F07_17450 [Lachnoclostridium sp. An169]HJA64913.1 Rpn family recombination-promoting nuclease/putative transposase [Candidatus Mediterraneibacter cottocaccae]
MPFRVLEIDFVNYARQMRIIRDRHEAEWRDSEGHMHKPENVTPGEYLGRFLKTDRIVRCVTLVVYWGEKPWDGPLKLSDLFAGEAGTSHTVQMDMNFLDVCRMTDEEILGYTSELRTVFGFKKYARNKEKLKTFIDSNQKYFRNVSETALNALDELTHSPELQKIRTSKYQTPEGGFDMCQGIQEMIQDGIQEGKRDGIREGEIKKAKEMSISLAGMGLSADKIAEAANVSVQLVQDWLSEKSENEG